MNCKNFHKVPLKLHFSESTSPVKSPEELKKEKEAIDRIVNDIPEDEEEHLDLTLDEEAQFLTEYSTLLNSLT